MGATGSTRWKNHQKKMTVEQCEFDPESGWIVIDSGFLGKQKLFEHMICIEGECLEFEDFQSGILPSYETSIGIGYLKIPIQIVFTQQNFGGKRWWFICQICSRKVKKLYAPSEANDFACRICQDLTYFRSQTSHCRTQK